MTMINQTLKDKMNAIANIPPSMVEKTLGNKIRETIKSEKMDKMDTACKEPTYVKMEFVDATGKEPMFQISV